MAILYPFATLIAATQLNLCIDVAAVKHVDWVQHHCCHSH